jgi:CheY-like chemotaxis protein
MLRIYINLAFWCCRNIGRSGGPPVPVKVLIVEDDLPTLELMNEVLTSLKVEVCALHDSPEAAVLVNRERFDGIFVDLQMPKMDGFELARHIRASSWNKTAPIIIVTAQDDPKTMQKAFGCGATFFLQKPVDRQRLTNLFKAVRGRMFENRRQFVRVQFQAEVICQIGHQTFQGQSSNISQGGILLDLGRRVESGTAVRVSFRLPGRNLKVDASGVVARVDEKLRAGVRFLQIGPRELQAIRDLVMQEDNENAGATTTPTN